MSQQVLEQVKLIAKRFGGSINANDGYIKFGGSVFGDACKRRAAAALAEITHLKVRASMIESFRGWLVVFG
jgi:hypothetical protein